MFMRSKDSRSTVLKPGAKKRRMALVALPTAALNSPNVSAICADGSAACQARGKAARRLLDSTNEVSKGGYEDGLHGTSAHRTD